MLLSRTKTFRAGSFRDVVARVRPDATKEDVVAKESVPGEGNQSFRIIFFAIPSAAVRSESGMNGFLLQPGRDEEGLCSPGLHRVTGWAAISFSSRAASSSRVSPSNTRLPAFRMR